MTEDMIKEWYEKAEKVIDGCLNEEQLGIAFNYTELYIKQTKDTSGYDVLLRKYYKKKEDLMVV